MTSAGLVRASVLLTAQTCIAANLTGVEDPRRGGPCSGSGRTDGEEKRTLHQAGIEPRLTVCSKVPLGIVDTDSSTLPLGLSGTMIIFALRSIGLAV